MEKRKKSEWVFWYSTKENPDVTVVVTKKFLLHPKRSQNWKILKKNFAGTNGHYKIGYNKVENFHP